MGWSFNLCKPHVLIYPVNQWSCSVVSDSVAPWTVAYQAPPSLEFSRQDSWSGLPFPSPGELTDPGIKPRSPVLQADALPERLSYQGSLSSSISDDKSKNNNGNYPKSILVYKALSTVSGIVIVQSLNSVRLFVTPWTAACQDFLSFIISWSLLKLMSIELVMPSNHFTLCRPLLLLPSIFPSIRVFSNESALLIRWSKYWGFSFSIGPSNKYSALISFRNDWFDLLAVQGTSQEPSAAP